MPFGRKFAKTEDFSLNLKATQVSTVWLVTKGPLFTLFYTNHAEFVSVGCFSVSVFGCVSTHLRNGKTTGWLLYCFERSSLSVPIWDNIFSS